MVGAAEAFGVSASSVSRHLIEATAGKLKERVGSGLVHQRCTIHKDRNIQRHLAKRWRQEAHRRFRAALEQNSYADAKRMLRDFEQWLRQLNESAETQIRRAHHLKY